MGGDYVIYSYFNAEQIQAVLNAIVMLVGGSAPNGDYLSLLRVAALLGLIMAVLYGFLRARGEDAAYYLIMVALFYSTLFVPRVTVQIEDHGGGVIATPRTVANVPLGLAFFASTTSHIGHWLTQRSETFFSLPDTSLKMAQNGLMGGSRALRKAQSASIPDPILAQDMTSFVRECINPELVTTPASIPALLASRDIWGDFGTIINPGRMVTLIGNSGAVSCSFAYTALTPRLNAGAASELTRIALEMAPQSTQATAEIMFKSLLPAAEGLSMTASASAQDAIFQRMMINLLNDTSSNMAQITNDPVAAQTALGTAIATSNANSSYRVMAKMAQEALPVIRNAIELVILGIFPIILFLIIIAGSKGGLVLRSYVMTMLWVQLWAPLYAIVNFVGTMQAAKSARAALAGIDGVTVNNAAALLNTTLSSEAVVGLLTVSVPMIALAIIKGGEVAMSGVTSGLMAPTSSAATAAGSQVGSGNVNVGNTSWGNYQANTARANVDQRGLVLGSRERAEVEMPRGSYEAAVGMGPNVSQIGNIQLPSSNVLATATTTARVEQGTGLASGTEASYSRGTTADLTRGTSGGLSQQGNAGLSRSQMNIVEQAIQASKTHSKGQNASDHAGTSTGTGTVSTNGHTEQAKFNTGAGVKAGVQAGADAPTGQAQPQGVVPGVPPAQVPGGAPAQGAPAQNLPAATQQQIQQSAAAAAQAIGAPVAGGTAAPTGKKPVKASAGASADASLQVATTESNNFESKQTSGSEKGQRIEKSASEVAQAVRSQAARTNDAAQRAYLESWAASFAKQVDSRYGTNVASRLTESASQTASRSEVGGASLSVNRGEDVAQAALAASGGNVYEMARNVLGNKGFIQGVAAGVGGNLRNEVAPAGGAAKDIGGGDIAPPKTVDSVKKEGDAAVQSARASNDAAASAAGSAAIAQAAAKADSMGVPKTGPDDAAVANEVDGTKADSQAQLSGMQASVPKSVGGQMLLSSVFTDQGGMGRLADSMLGGFFGRAKTPEQNQEALGRVIAANPGFENRLTEIYNRGSATEEDREAFYQAAKNTK